MRDSGRTCDTVIMVAEKGIQGDSSMNDDPSCVQSAKELTGDCQQEQNGDQEQSDSNVNSDLSMDNFCEVVVTFRCKFCHCVCNDKVSMKVHIIKAHADKSKSVLQESLDKSTEVDSSANNQQSESVNSGTDEMKQEVFFCSECSIIFSSAKLCCDHMTLVHNLSEFSTELIRENPLNSPPTVNKRKRIRCATQDKVSKDNGKKSKLSSNNSSKHLCTLCKTKFKSTVAVQTHEKCHIFVADMSQSNNCKNEKTWVKGYVCCYCDKTTDKFITWGQCAFHLWKEHEIDCDLYTCSVCKFKSPTMAKLKDHERLHKSEANFKCNTCRKTFKQFKQLKTHENYHKINMTELPPPTDARWYTPKECPICHRILSDSKCLKKHISAVHNKMKPYSCNICGHTSARKAELQLHVRQHTGEKPYKCGYSGCNFTTGDHNSLRKHKLRHGGVRPYKCPHCDYCVIQSHAYKKHVLATHPGKDVVFVCSSCPLVSVNENFFEAHRKDHEEGRLPVENQNDTNTSKVNHSKHNGVDESSGSYTQDNEFTEKNDGKSSDKYWLRDVEDDEVVDTGGITIPATDSESNSSFNPSSTSNKTSVQACQETQQQKSTTNFLSDNSIAFSIGQQNTTEQDCIILESPSQSTSQISNPVKPTNKTKSNKKKRPVQKTASPKVTQDKPKKKVTKPKNKVVQNNGKPKKKKSSGHNQPELNEQQEESTQSSIRPMSSQPHSSTSFGSSIDESRAINMVAELLADTDSNSLQFLDPILSMGINDSIDLADIICNDHYSLADIICNDQ